jgi:hypothetical protein
MPSCSTNFRTQFCWINNRQYFINDYIINKESFRGERATCEHGHTLVLANGEIRAPYFRHLNPEDTGGVPMTKWHAEWQSHFSKTEIVHRRKNSDQIKERRADIELDDGRIVEIQHSEISKEEVDNRKNDYTAVHGKEVSWIIHANGCVNVNKFERTGRVYLEFNSDYWKYESFLEYNYIYLDIDSAIYKISPRKVKSHMVDVEWPKEKADFITALKAGVNLWADNDPTQCTLFIKQQGAGNGKTYGIIQMLLSDEFAHHTTFIFVTKQHSAKTIIENEFESQVQGGSLPHISEATVEDNNKKYIIEFRNEKTGKDIRLVIATIDSLMYNIGNKNHTFYDKFQGIIDSIIDGHIDADKAGIVKFAGVNPKLNKETMLILDEAQDLTVNYAEAIVNIMRNKYIDAYIVGDKLQSISHEQNAFTYLSEHEFPSIKLERFPPTNICRRFTHPKLVRFCNEMTPFNKYGLPAIEPYVAETPADNDVLHFFEAKTQSKKAVSKDSSENKSGSVMNDQLDIIMKHFTEEVDANNRQPNDFLIITPFTNNNPLVELLQGKINTFWKERIGNNEDEYFRYAIFHKSEEGSSIDLNESAHSTRIVSIHSSKGDGRNVVFMIGFTESALRRFSGAKDTLLYDSLFHVAITRMKQKLYIQYQNNGDAFVRKLNGFIHRENDNTQLKPSIYFYNSIKYADIVTSLLSTNYSEVKENIISQTNVEALDETNTEKRIIDMGNHSIRYSSLLISILINIVNKENGQVEGIKKQIKALLHRVADASIAEISIWNCYNNLIAKNELAIMKLSSKGRDYLRYYDFILESMRNIQEKLDKGIKGQLLPTFCPIESVILNHMIGIISRGEYADISITDVYNIVDVYSKSYNVGTSGHSACLCEKHFSKKKDCPSSNTSVDNMRIYLHNHFEKIKYIDKVMGVFHQSYPKLNWLMDHTVKYGGQNTNYKVWRQFTLVGYDDSTVLVAYIKPQFNALNFNEVLMNSMYDAYILSNVKKDEEKESDKRGVASNYERFHGKKIVSCVFTLDRTEPYYISWYDGAKNLIEANSEMFKQLVYKYIDGYYSSENCSIQYFYKYWRTNCPTEHTAPKKFIEFLLDEYTKIKDVNDTGKKGIPSYIDDFLKGIKFRLEASNNRDERKELLARYDDPAYFIESLNETMRKSVKRFFNIKMDEDDDDE